MLKQVFISYSSEDQQIAYKICVFLEERTINCWIAPRDVVPGAEYGEEIINAIENTEIMLLVLSANSNRSRHVRNEVERAVSKGKVILPVRTEEVVPSKALELFVSSPHWIDIHIPPLEERLSRLELAVKGILGQGVALVEDGGHGYNPDSISAQSETSIVKKRGIITGNRVFLRKGPTVAANVLQMLNQGEEVEIVSEITINDSRECQLNNDIKFLPEGGKPYRLFSGRGLVISGETHTDYRIEINHAAGTDIGYIPKKSVTLLKPATWYKVKKGAQEGWVFSRYVRIF